MDNFSIILIIIIIILVIIVGAFIFILNKKLKNKDDDKESELLIETIKTLKDDLKTDIRETRRELDSKIYTGQKDMHESVKFQSETYQKLIKEVTDSLGKVTESVTEVKEGNKQVFSMTEQLANLEKVLTNQKTRGN